MAHLAEPFGIAEMAASIDLTPGQDRRCRH
jgi:hypothetical protein